MVIFHGYVSLPDGISWFINTMNTIAGWWFQPAPVKNDGVRQLG